MLLVAPYWTTYPEAIKLAGGVPVEVVTDETTGYMASVEQLEAARTSRTKVLLFVSPSNPTGAVYSPDAGRARSGPGQPEHDLWTVTDEIYEHLVYGGRGQRLDRAAAPARRSSSSTASPRPTR